MTVNFEEQKENGNFFVKVVTFEGKNYAFVEDAELFGNDFLAIVVGEDDRLYYAYLNFDNDKDLEEQDYEMVIDIKPIDSYCEAYRRYDCHYDD